MNKQIKKGNLNFDQSGRAYPDNPQIKENWDCIWDGDAYKNYLKNFTPPECPPNLDVQPDYYEPMSKDMFIYGIKTDDEFAKKWGVIVEVRELSMEERTEYKKKRDGISRTFASYTHQMLDGSNIPTKAISLTYNNQTEVIYE